MATWHTGDTEQIVITVTEDDVNVSSLAGATVEFVLYASNGTSVLTKDTDDFTLSAPTMTCELAATDLDGLEGAYRYEIRVTDSGGDTQSAVGTLPIVAVTI